MTVKQATFLIFILVVLFFAFPINLQAEEPDSVRIEGVVRDLTSGTPAAPIGSVDIIINGWMVVHSGRDGEWNITGLRPGEYTVELGLPRDSYTPAQDVITVGLWTPGTTERLDLNFYQGMAPAGMFMGTDEVAPPKPAVPEPSFATDSDALVAPPLVPNEAQIEETVNGEAETGDQVGELTPELEGDETALQITAGQTAGAVDGEPIGAAIPGLGGAGPQLTTYDQLNPFGYVVGGFVMIIGLFFVASGVRPEGGRNVE